MNDKTVDIAILGCGPAGLAAACECMDRGLTYAFFVFSLLGHRPESEFIHGVLGLDQRMDGRPVCDLRTWRLSRPRMVVAGSLADPSIDVILRIRDQAREAVASLVDQLGFNP